jgi:hypothetical protein
LQPWPFGGKDSQRIRRASCDLSQQRQTWTIRQPVGDDDEVEFVLLQKIDAKFTGAGRVDLELTRERQ